MPLLDPYAKARSQEFLRQNFPGVFSANSPINWAGNLVPDGEQYYSPIRQMINGVAHYAMVANPAYNSGLANTTPAPTPAQFQYTFDTLGQVIYRSIGHCRLPLRTIWAQGISESGDTSVSNTQTFAAALCAPIDPLEQGEIFAIWDGGSKVFNSDGVVTPAGWTPEDAALLATSLAGIVIYPGDEAQLPAALIVADKGADKTNAFRGIRYLIFPDYPLRNGGGLPQLSVGWQRTTGEPPDPGAVEFLAGAD